MKQLISGQSENQMLDLANEVYRLTNGACKAGAGPYGIGLSNPAGAKIGLVFSFDPGPVRNNEIFPPSIPQYQVKVHGFWQETDSYLDPYVLDQLTQEADAGTRSVAAALQQLSGKVWTVTHEECRDAFCALAELELGGVGQAGKDILGEQQQSGPELTL